MGLIKKVKKAVRQKLESVKLQTGNLYDYSTSDARVNTVRFLYAYAKNQRMEQVAKWLTYNDYYEGRHKTQMEIQESCQERGLPFIPAVIQDPYIHVESQIIPEIPDFEFSGRDDDTDNMKAKQRQYVVQYIIDDNQIDGMNTENERQLNKLGNAFWKVAYDYSLQDGQSQGKIVIGNPDPANIFPDPSALELDDCEYIDYVYRLHKIKAGRVFAADLKRLGITVFDLATDGLYSETEIYYDSTTHDVMTDTLQVIEHWFRQPFDGEDTYEYTENGVATSEKVQWKSGDMACIIIIGNREIRYIPKYWVNTGLQNKLYPLVKYCKVPINKSFWDRSELAPIIDLVDTADRELALSILNDTFNANDITIMEENALSDDSEMENVPGAVWKVKSGQINNVRRLGGLSGMNTGLENTITFIRDHIKEVVGNFDVNQGGGPPSNVKTLGGLVELKQQGEQRQSLKKADRTAGFECLYELIDWIALEFYDDNRLIFLGAEGDVQEQQQIQANGMMSQEQQIEYAQQQQAMQQQAQQTGQQAPPIQPPNMDRTKGPVIFKFDSSQYNKDGYYPRIDTTVAVGDGIEHNKAFTLSATETIANMQIGVENYKIVCQMIDIMQLPDRKEIKQYLEQYFSNLQMGIPKTTIAYKDLDAAAKVQMAQKIGIQIQQPVNTDAQGVPWSILAQNNPNVYGNVPLASQGQQQPQQPQIPQITHQALVSKLSDPELMHLMQNPQLLEQAMQSLKGGQPNG
ncbi:MAG: hypothetical protein P4L49_02680 [Desulfosporosinus sp.]|nr:hypothetical protein [Desulfosporosinus sp.]